MAEKVKVAVNIVSNKCDNGDVYKTVIYIEKEIPLKDGGEIIFLTKQFREKTEQEVDKQIQKWMGENKIK